MNFVVEMGHLEWFNQDLYSNTYVYMTYWHILKALFIVSFQVNMSVCVCVC